MQAAVGLVPTRGANKQAGGLVDTWSRWEAGSQTPRVFIGADPKLWGRSNAAV